MAATAAAWPHDFGQRPHLSSCDVECGDFRPADTPSEGGLEQYIATRGRATRETSMTKASKRFFISYASPDRPWAEWVGWHLEQVGHTVILDVWDWAAGDDFVQHMDQALAQADAVVSLFSRSYFDQSRWTNEEWSATVARRDRIIPLALEPISTADIPPLLAVKLRKDLHGLDEASAVTALREAINGGTRPISPPPFPDNHLTSATNKPRLPSSQGESDELIRRHRNSDLTEGGTRRGEETTLLNPPAPGTFSIRPPYGELPPRVRGRDELLGGLATRLVEGEGRTQILHGMGGCGKTTVALHLARQARDEGYRVFWISATTPSRLITGMREVARELGARSEDIEAAWSGRNSATDLVWERLDAGKQRWLLIIDNVDEPSWLASESGGPGDGTGWLRSSRAGMAVVTTRVGNPEIWGQEAETHRIGVLEATDGRDVLLDLAGEAGDPEEALLLAKRLDGLPLALKLAGSYLARSARGAGLIRNRSNRSGGRLRNFAAYTKALGEAGAGLLDQGESWRQDEAEKEKLHRRLVGRTWELSLNLLEDQQLPEARTLMRLLSCCAPAPFPIELMNPDVLSEVAVRGDVTLTGMTGWAERADRALEALIDLSLVDVIDIGPNAPGNEREPVSCLVIHRLVLEANALRLRDDPTFDRQVIWRSMARILERGTAPAPELPGNWAWWRLLAPHVVVALATAPGDEVEEVLTPLLRSGLAVYAFYNFSTFGQGDDLAKLLLSRGAILAPNHPVRLSIRHRAALSLLSGEEELREYESVLEEQSAQLGWDHPETLITRYNATISRHDCGLTSDAEEEAELRAVLEDRRRILGSNNPYTLLTHGALAERMTQRRHEEGDGEAEYKALIEHTASRTPEDYRFLPLENRHRMAHTLDKAQRWTEAEAEYRSVLADLEENEWQAAKIYWSMTRCLTRNLIHQERQQDAITLLDQSLTWFDGSDTDRSSTREEALWLRHKRGDLMRQCNRPEEAEREIRSVLEDRLRTADPKDSAILSERHCLAHTIDALNRHNEAQNELRSVVTTLTEILGLTDKSTRDTSFCLARMLHLHGDKAEALRLYEQVLTAEIAEYGQDHSETLMTRFRRDQCLFDMDLMPALDAKKSFEHTMATLTVRYGNDHHWIKSIREALSKINTTSRK